MKLSWKKLYHQRVGDAPDVWVERTYLVVDELNISRLFITCYDGRYSVRKSTPRKLESIPLLDTLFTTEDEAKAALIALYRLGGIP